MVATLLDKDYGFTSQDLSIFADGIRRSVMQTLTVNLSSPDGLVDACMDPITISRMVYWLVCSTEFTKDDIVDGLSCHPATSIADYTIEILNGIAMIRYLAFIVLGDIRKRKRESNLRRETELWLACEHCVSKIIESIAALLISDRDDVCVLTTCTLFNG